MVTHRLCRDAPVDSNRAEAVAEAVFMALTCREVTVSNPPSEAPSTPGPLGVVEVDADERESLAGPWRTVVWNDPVNLMSYVSYVFRSYFGYSQATADRLMLDVHEHGRAVVSRGSREKVETDVHAMHSFGLHATVEKDREN